ncbi:hypothetical protein AVEN_130357-1 [Araneus ventricosus]|uniref:Uncharacterized protein n=1 Tax=Araneus ventricosus TaxID=182803 RepID=A0A4Y2BFT4_ARAVE|nr:hypothetical protein AVEN_130357-1 [Araneus ventricosus]
MSRTFVFVDRKLHNSDNKALHYSPTDWKHHQCLHSFHDDCGDELGRFLVRSGARSSKSCSQRHLAIDSLHSGASVQNRITASQLYEGYGHLVVCLHIYCILDFSRICS